MCYPYRDDLMVFSTTDAIGSTQISASSFRHAPDNGVQLSISPHTLAPLDHHRAVC
jgi:hypothetical protein